MGVNESESERERERQHIPCFIHPGSTLTALVQQKTQAQRHLALRLEANLENAYTKESKATQGNLNFEDSVNKTDGPHNLTNIYICI